MSLPESFERAATNLADLADQIRPANGDPHRLLEELKPQQASEVLVWILANEPDSAEELVEAWGEWEKGGEVLLSLTDAVLSDRGVSKAGRKILRRAHHRLRSRGIAVKTDVEPSVSTRRPIAVEDPFEAAFLSSPDFRGARVGYLANRHPAGGARLFEVRFDEARGIIDFKVYNAGRSKVRGFLRSLSSAQAHRLFDVSRTALCALVRRASLAQPFDRPLPSGFMEWRGRVFPESLDGESTPGGLIRAELADIAKSETAVEEVVALIMDGSVGPWPPASSWVSEWMDKGRDEVAGLESDARESAITDWRDAVAAALVETDDRELLARHLEELAWVHRQTHGPAEAASLIAAADALVSDDAAHLRIAGARVDSLFAPFLGELRIADDEPSDEVSQTEAAADAG
jgi:hypothetical protein